MCSILTYKIGQMVVYLLILLTLAILLATDCRVCCPVTRCGPHSATQRDTAQFDNLRVLRISCCLFLLCVLHEVSPHRRAALRPSTE